MFPVMDLIGTFRSIVTAYIGAVANCVQHLRPPPEPVLWALPRLHRLAARIHKLYTRWLAGTLPRLRPSRAGQPRPARPAPPRLPARFGWLTAHGDHEARGAANRIEALVNTADFARFIAAEPRAVRLIRPLRRMLGLRQVPPEIGPPHRPRPVKITAAEPVWIPPPPAPSFAPPLVEFVTGTPSAFPRMPGHLYRRR